jgi:hypothetical protein
MDAAHLATQLPRVGCGTESITAFALGSHVLVQAGVPVAVVAVVDLKVFCGLYPE